MIFTRSLDASEPRRPANEKPGHAALKKMRNPYKSRRQPSIAPILILPTLSKEE
jgi:hypothetical protein